MSETLIGVIIGAASAILGGILGELVKFYLDIIREHKARRREVYIRIEKCLLYIENTKMLNYLPTEDLRKLIEDSSPYIDLYASKKIRVLYGSINELAKVQNNNTNIELQEKIEKLKEIMRKELSITKN